MHGAIQKIGQVPHSHTDAPIVLVQLPFPSQVDPAKEIVRVGSGNLNSGDKWNFCLASA